MLKYLLLGRVYELSLHRAGLRGSLPDQLSSPKKRGRGGSRGGHIEPPHTATDIALLTTTSCWRLDPKFPSSHACLLPMPDSSLI